MTSNIQFIPQIAAKQDFTPIQTAKPSKSFYEVMQAAQQKEPTKTTQPTNKKSPVDTTQPTKTNQDTTVTFEGTQKVISTLESTDDNLNSSIRTILMGLFGMAAEGIDMEQSDADILKDLLGNLRDPEQKFAVMLMMAFLQENPECTLADLASKMPPADAMPAITGASPVNTVMNAMFKFMEADSSIKSFPLLEVAKQLQLTTPEDKQTVFLKQLHEMDAKVISASQTMQTQQGTQQETQQNLQSDLWGQERFRGAIAEVKQVLRATPKQGDETESTDVEKLQQQVNTGAFLRGTAVYTPKVISIPMTPDTQALLTQVRTGIFTNIEAAKTDFVMKLTPEGLGELTVKLSEVAGKMTLTLTASNSQTQRLLESQMTNLREVMKPYEVEVSQIVGSKGDAAEKFGGEFGQQFGEHRHQEMEQHRQNGAFQYEQDDVPETANMSDPFGYSGGETINTYI